MPPQTSLNLFPLDAAIPIIEVTDGKTKGYSTFNFRERWNNLANRLGQSAYLIGDPLSLSGQHASIGARPITTQTLAAGIYRVGWTAHITTPDGVSSSLTVTIGWTQGGQALTISGAAITGDAATSVQSGVIQVVNDASSPITLATTYASNTPGKMLYELKVTLEFVSA